MSETTASTPAIVKDWELDPTDKCGFKDPDDITRWLENYATYREQLTCCISCPLQGRGAICAAELKLPDVAAATILMTRCEADLKKGYPKPMDGHKLLRSRVIGSKSLAFVA
ncbi:hypothetical protein EYC58_05275 [Candidatus Saccharibacteria bacterium]|nr:MAG: hypothetical protein EYC58_05275 [Candidatus Saccharibacteria bacterium]